MYFVFSKLLLPCPFSYQSQRYYCQIKSAMLHLVKRRSSELRSFTSAFSAQLCRIFEIVCTALFWLDKKNCNTAQSCVPVPEICGLCFVVVCVLVNN